MNRETLSARLKDKRGTVTIVVVLAMLMLIGFAAFAIDVGYMMVSRNELQNIADTAALAAAGELGLLYSKMTYTAALEYKPDAKLFLIFLR
jgi:Flp pilus assembly protein TadG